MQCGLNSSPWVSATATIVHLHPVSITGYSNGSFGFSASLSRQVFAMWSPFRIKSVSVLVRSEGSSSAFLVFGWSLRDEVVEFVSDLVWNVDSSCTFPRGWCRAFAMGTPASGRVAYFCALDRNEGFFCPSILSCFAMGPPYGSSVVFLPLDRN